MKWTSIITVAQSKYILKTAHATSVSTLGSDSVQGEDGELESVLQKKAHLQLQK